MAVRALPLVCLGLSSLLLVPAACSGGTESDDGSTVASAGAGGIDSSTGGDGSTAGQASSAGSTSTTGGAAGDASSAGAPQGGVAGAANEGGAPVAGGAGAGGAEACGAVVEAQALANGLHMAACSDLVYATNPPSSGEHYPTWADYGVYDFALPRGYWVHNLEHGSVVVTYNCDDGCAEELAAAKAWLAALEPDALCAGQTPRVLLVPDPLLDVRWAASSWGYTLRADCFDADAFSDFYVAHAGKSPAPEAVVCVTGTDFRAAGACGAK
jgi:hypothetical protein